MVLLPHLFPPKPSRPNPESPHTAFWRLVQAYEVTRKLAAHVRHKQNRAKPCESDLVHVKILTSSKNTVLFPNLAQLNSGSRQEGLQMVKHHSSAKRPSESCCCRN